MTAMETFKLLFVMRMAPVYRTAPIIIRGIDLFRIVRGTVFEREDVGIGEIIVPKKGIVFPLTVQLHQYDANGNVTKDWERGLDMSYNCLNLLEYASDNDANAINYCYLADGTKLSVTDVGENGLYYLGSLVYEKHANTIGLKVPGSAAAGSWQQPATTPRFVIS